MPDCPDLKTIHLLNALEAAHNDLARAARAARTARLSGHGSQLHAPHRVARLLASVVSELQAVAIGYASALRSDCTMQQLPANAHQAACDTAESLLAVSRQLVTTQPRIRDTFGHVATLITQIQKSRRRSHYQA